jgi:hypothetical protein
MMIVREAVILFSSRRSSQSFCRHPVHLTKCRSVNQRYIAIEQRPRPHRVEMDQRRPVTGAFRPVPQKSAKILIFLVSRLSSSARGDLNPLSEFYLPRFSMVLPRKSINRVENTGRHLKQDRCKLWEVLRRGIESSAKLARVRSGCLNDRRECELCQQK